MPIHGSRSDVVACILQLPDVRESATEVENDDAWSALCLACARGDAAIVQLLLDAGSDPTFPFGDKSPLNVAISKGRPTVVDLLRRAIAELERARAVFKARALVDAAHALPKARQDAIDKGLSVAAMQRAILRATPPGLKKHVRWGWKLPRVELAPKRKKRQQDKQLRATVAFVVGFEGSKVGVMPQEVFDELLDYMLPANLIT